MFNRLKEFFTVPLDISSRNYIVDSWYDAELRLWSSAFKDERGNQVGIVGHGPTKKSAELDLQYQNEGVI